MPNWLSKLRKPRKSQEEQYEFPPVTPEVGVEYVPMKQYSELLERVSHIEQKISVSVNPQERLDCPDDILDCLPNVVKKNYARHPFQL